MALNAPCLLVEPDCSPDEWNRELRLNPERDGLPRWEAIRANNLGIQYRRELGDDLNPGQDALLARIIAVQVQLELGDARMRDGAALPKEYASLSATLLRLLKELGLERKKKAPAVDLASYLAGKAGNDTAKAVQPGGGDLPWMAGGA